MEKVAGEKMIVLRCPFCHRRSGQVLPFSHERKYPPGKCQFGIDIKCSKCGIVTRH